MRHLVIVLAKACIMQKMRFVCQNMPDFQKIDIKKTFPGPPDISMLMRSAIRDRERSGILEIPDLDPRSPDLRDRDRRSGDRRSVRLRFFKKAIFLEEKRMFSTRCSFSYVGQ